MQYNGDLGMDDIKNIDMPDFDKDKWATNLKDLILKNYDMVIANNIEINPTTVNKSVQTKRVDGVECPLIIDINAEVLLHFQLKENKEEN